MTPLSFPILRACLMSFAGLLSMGLLALLARDIRHEATNGSLTVGDRSKQRKIAEHLPTLSDDDFFRAINLDFPGLSRVKISVQAGNLADAKAAFAQYLRSRSNVHWFFDWRHPSQDISYDQTYADNCIAGQFAYAGYNYQFPGGDIDWNHTPSATSQWVTLLNRMDFWHDIGATYWGTADTRYTTAWVKQLRSWIQQNPRPIGAQNILHPWATIDLAERMKSSWPDSFFRHITSPAFTDENVILFVKSCIEQGRHLRRYNSGAGILNTNINAWEFSGLYTVGCVFPECIEASEWRRFAAQKMHDQECFQFYPDGAHIELSPRYHIGTMNSIMSLYKIAEINQRQAELPANFLSRMEQAYEFMLFQAAPTRLLPPYNDCGSANEDVRSYLSEGYQLFPQRSDFSWLSGGGTPPRQTSHHFPYAGYAAMRSDWQSSANYLNFDTGPLGSSRHRHDDSLNLTLWAWGRELLFDSGGGSYEAGIWRTWGTSSYSHNCITVDGMDMEGGNGHSSAKNPDYHAQKPHTARWESTPHHDFAAGFYNRGYGGNYKNRPATQNRRVLFVKPDLFIIADTLTPTDTATHTYQARWHVLSTNTSTAAATQTVCTVDAALANLAIVPCNTAGMTTARISGQLSAKGSGAPVLAEMMGWDQPNLSQGAQTPATTVTHTLSGTGVKHFLTLLLPLKPGQSDPVIAVTPIGPNAAEVRLHDGRKLQIQADPDPTKGITCKEILRNGAVGRFVNAGTAERSTSDSSSQSAPHDDHMPPQP